MSDPTELAERVENVRRYARMTLESISVERQGMAEDILAILGEETPADCNVVDRRGGDA